MTTTIPEPFTVNGRYEISERPLGEGGMGVVYKAYDVVTKRFVALKTLWADATPEVIKTFEREWTVLARLSHPNIVDILDTGDWVFHGQRRPYFVMPLLPGASLDQLIKSSSLRLTVERTVDIISQACRGLQAAHDQNLVHRDIKPSNIFVMEDDTVKIIDFGVALRGEGRTATALKGTLLYMAPEQLDLKPATALSDIFSLAVVCYEALTGRKPFARETDAGVVDAIRAAIPPSASEINPAVNQMVSRTVHKAMAKQPWHRFSQAREFGETLQKAVRNEPIERFERAKIQPRIERIKKAYAEGDHQFAQEILVELESEGHIDPDMSALRIQIEQAIRQKTIRQLLENARIRMEEEEYPLALQKVADVLAYDPNHGEALRLKDQIERLRGEHQVDNWFRLVREHLDNSLFGQARLGLQEILKLDSSNTLARQMLAEIDHTEQEIAKTREDKQKLYESAVSSYRNGDISNALTRLERVLVLSRRTIRSTSPELDAQCQSLYEQVRTERDNARNAYTEGRKHLLSCNIPRALEICEEYLNRHPGDPMFQALKLEVEEVQRQEQSAAIADVSRRVDAEADLDRKYNILQEAVEKYPSEPHFRSAQKLIRDRRDLVNAIVSRARQYEERGQFNDAAGQWDILRNIYPLFPGLDLELERLTRRKEEQVRVEAKARWMEQIDSHLNSGDYAKAYSVIGEALNEFPEDRELVQLEALAEQNMKRSAEANLLLKQGQEFCAAHNYEDGLTALRGAEKLDPRNRTARAALLSGLVAYARDLMSKDWRAGEQPVKEALDLEPSDPVARSLLSILDDHRRQEAIANLLVAARNYQADGHLADALQLVERGLVQYPNDHRLIQLFNSLRTQAGKPLGQSFAAAANAEQVAEIAPLAAASGLESALAEAPQPKMFAAPASAPPPPGGAAPPIEQNWDKALIRQPKGQRRGVRPPRVEEPPPVREPIPLPGMLDEVRFKGAIWAIGVLGVLAILAAALYPLWNEPKRPADSKSLGDARSQAPTPTLVSEGRAVVFESNVPGTTFSENGRPLALASELSLGEHSVEANHAGYLPEQKTFTVTPANTHLSVPFELRPILPQLRVNSSITRGKLVIDETESVDFEGGSASKDDLALGSHTVKIFDHGRPVFSFGFQVEANEKPILTTPLLSEPVAGAVISSLAGSAKIYATRGLRASAALPLVPVPPLGLDLNGTSDKPARFLLDTGGAEHLHSQALSQLVDNSDSPTITVQLAGETVKTFMLTVTSNVEDCKISVDGEILKGSLNGLARSFPINAGSHPVALMCPGYQDAQQTAVIRPDDSEAVSKLDFVMKPVVAEPRWAQLSIAGAPPEAAVFQNQVRIGTIGLDGTFSKEIEPGTYTWEWRKPGFEARNAARTVKAGDAVRLDGALTPANGSLTLKVVPENARIIARRDAEGSPIVLPNNTAVLLAAGSYRVTAEAADYNARSENVLIAAGKPLGLTWDLEKRAVVPAPVRFFQNGDEWRPSSEGSGWWVHGGAGYSAMRSSTGTFSIDFLRKKAGKKIVIMADCKDVDNCVIFTLDGHNLTSKVLMGGKTLVETKKPHGMDENSSFHLLFEMSPDAMVVKNRAGNVLASVERRDFRGKLLIQNDIPLNIN